MYRFVVLMILSMCLLQCSKTPKGETDTENTVDAQDSVDSDVKSDLSSHGETDSDSDGDTHVDSDDDTDTGTDTNTNTGTFSDSDTASDSSSQGDTAGDSDSDTESDSETHSDIESGSGTESGSDTVADTDSNSDSESESGADSDSSSQGDTETDNSVIPTTCSAASRQVTSVGCEFYVADLGDSALTYAVVVSNPQHSTPANVRIEDMRDSGGALRTLPGMDIVLDASELHVFELTCESGCPETTSHVYGTGLLPGSAFRVVSDVPILAYQWNTYGDDMYSCDASLLIPAANLGTSYIGAAWPYNIDAYLTVVANQGQYRHYVYAHFGDSIR